MWSVMVALITPVSNLLQISNANKCFSSIKESVDFTVEDKGRLLHDML